jgi:hypothetical protein
MMESIFYYFGSPKEDIATLNRGSNLCLHVPFESYQYMSSIYKTLLVNTNPIHLIKQTKPLNFDPLILYWVRV